MGEKNNTDTMLTRDSADGTRLHARWKKLRTQPHDPMFDDFKAFCIWSMRNGYTTLAKLVRSDESKPYTPENCTWREPQKDHIIYGDEAREWCRKWHEAVNRIRLHYGMEPLTIMEESAE